MADRSYDVEKLVKWYDEHSETYDETSFTPSEDRYAGDRYRIELVSQVLGKLAPESILDIGCGTAEPMIHLLQAGMKVKGFDLSPGMIAQAKKKLAKLGYDEGLVSVDNVLASDLHERYPPESFDAVVANGVLPYIEDDRTAHDNMIALVKPGGVYIGAYSNALFDLFTFNRFTLRFFEQQLLPKIDLPESQLESVRKGLSSLLTHPDSPKSIPIGARDDIYVRSHVHFEVRDEMIERGLTPEDLMFYKFHAFPPLLRSNQDLKSLFMESSRGCEIRMSRDWQAMFMSSTFIIVARKPA